MRDLNYLYIIPLQIISMIPLVLAVILILLAFVFLLGYKYKKLIIINKLMFAAGLIIALVAALMVFCQEDCFLGVDLGFWPMVLGIVGIGLIATSGYSSYRPPKGKKK